MGKNRRNALLTLSFLIVGLLSGLVAMQLALWYSDNLNQEMSQCNVQSTELQLIWFNAHRLDDLLRAYEQSSDQAQKNDRLMEFRTWSELITTSITQLEPLTFYNDNQRKILQNLKRHLHAYVSLREHVFDLPSNVNHLEIQPLNSPYAVQLKKELHAETDQILSLLNSTTSRDLKSVTIVQTLVRILLFGLILVSGATVRAEFVSQRVASKEMTSLNNQLQMQLEELQQARDEAIRASSVKSAFIANISHEVRTPLSGIIGTVELLLCEPLSTEQKAYAETVQQSADSLLSIVNDILDLSKMESGKLELRNTLCDPKEIVQDCTRLMSVNARAKNLYCLYRIDKSMPALVIADPDRFRQILLNLIGNAIKFTQQGGITIDVFVAEFQTDSLKIQANVIDTGIGISQANLGRLFKPFSQLNASTTGRPEGTGLGLLISRQLAQLMGGDIVATSELGKGSTFSATIQCGIPSTNSLENMLTPEPQVKSQPPLPTILPDSQVLIVEDNPVLQNLTAKQLQSLGIQVKAVSDGKTALAATELQSFDLILMDVHLPDVNGYDVTSAIRTRESGSDRHVPIIAMTAAAMASDREMCFHAGMDDYLSKPVKMNDMLRVVNRWLTLPHN